MKQTIDIEQIRSNYKTFVQNKKTLVLSLIDEKGNPFSSVAAFVELNGKFYIYISQIAEHFKLLQNAKLADVFFVADEANSPNHFATERARWQCTATYLGNEGHEEIFVKFNQVHSEKMMNLLRTLDFGIFELTPITGRYVVGFGKAFDLNYADDSITHVVIDKK